MKYHIILFAALSLAFQSAGAQGKGDADRPTATANGWFIGAQGGVPFGVSTFSSFGADNTRFGYSAGIYGGYRFSPVLSLEATAKWGRTNLSAQGCCADLGYWLGSDGVRYNAPVLNMGGWEYNNLGSSVCTQHYGLQLNVNVLGFFNATKHGRWTLEVSPVLGAVGTRASVRAVSDGTEAIAGDSRWHLGAGGSLQAGFQATKHLNIGVYSGLTYLTGERMDGIPVNLHKANYIWESGVKVGLRFGKRNRKEIPHQVRDDVKGVRDDVRAVVAPVVETPVVEEISQSSIPDQVRNDVSQRHSEDTTVRHSGLDPESDKQKTSSETTALDAGSPGEILPTIYFTFNSTRIRHSELTKIQQIRDMMLADPQMKIEVIGWTDTTGGKDINDAFSLWRANAVRDCLVSYGIEAERIEVSGNGMDTGASDDSKARRADCVTVKMEK